MRERRRARSVVSAEYLLSMRDIVARTEPVISLEGDPGPPELPSEDELRRREAKVAIHGSWQVLGLLHELSGQLGEFRSRVRYLHTMRGAPAGAEAETLENTWEAIEASRKSIQQLITDTLARINAELSSH